MFDMLQNPTNQVPLLYHCTAGKDRTGMASALILYALGMDDTTVMDDYLTSNQYIEAKFEKYVKAAPQLKDMFLVKASFLQSGLDAIKKNYGNVDDFLTKNLGVDAQKFRQLYLY
jgi:protein-tyrosine phosphatase